LTVKLNNRDAHAVDLGEGYIPVGECLRDAATLPKQPIRIGHPIDHKSLDLRGHILGDTAIPVRHPVDEDTIRPEHRALDIDCDPAARLTACMQSTHALINWMQASLSKFGKCTIEQNGNKLN
jgi:hypothetical protein